jgi:uncharacterized lipoprotein YmbA
MRNSLSLGNTGWAFVFAAFLFAACSSTPPTQFYKQENAAATPGEEIAIGVGPVDFPEYLDRPQIVTRKSQNQLEISEFHRWAGSLPQGFSRVLAKNISTLLPTDRVAVYPWDDTFSPTYQVKVDVEQFDGKVGERVVLRVIWSLLGQEGKRELAVRKSLIEEPVPTKDYDGLVAAQSNAVATLSREIVEEIRRLGM